MKLEMMQTKQRGVVPEDFQGDLLLSHCQYGLLIHVNVVDSHPAKNSERLHEILIVARERQILKLVDQLKHTQNFVGLVGINDGHAQNGFVLEIAIVLVT